MERTPINLFSPENKGVSGSYILDTSQPLMDMKNNTKLSNDMHENLELNPEKLEFMSCLALRHVKKMLLEEDTNENSNTRLEDAALQSVEKSFYDVLGKKYPPSPNNISRSDRSKLYSSYADPFSGSINDDKIQGSSLLEFKRGMEDGMKFLPNISYNDLDHGFIKRKLEEGEGEDMKCVPYNGKRRVDFGESSNGKGRKYQISVLYFKDSAKDEIFHKLLGLHGENYSKEVIRLREVMRTRRKLYIQDKTNEDSIDLRPLLINCSEAIAMNDTTSAEKLINQIRKQSSHCGNATQRLAHVFVNGLEARLYGTTNKLYQKQLSTRASLVDLIKAYHLYLIACPFVRTSDYFANQTILKSIGKASKLHIFHFGINFGFQWSTLIQAFSEKKEGPPKLRITFVDIHVLGFWHAEQVEEVRRRLHDYARHFNIPFEYKFIIVTRWDKIGIEDINIEKDEMVIVNCLHRLETLGHVSGVMHSPKNRVVDIIRQIKPHVFIQGIINGSLDGDLFETRFKQALFHFSAMFDFLDATIPRENKARQFLENDFACSIYNVIACEGSERIIRPDKYKQWHVSYMQAGFEQVPVDYAIKKELKDMVKDVHGETFFVEDDNQWILLGWKGRIFHALSSWRPKQT